MAACGAAVPQTAGRGLGHTGGTIDKMETIPGWRSTLAADEVVRILGDVGAVINAAGPDLAPADRKLYALRDITGTVESIPLIASSIMSKKIAEGTEALVLDVKVGTGAFMKEPGQARELAEVMVELGAAHGVRTTALLTQMDVPLGRTAGNALEVVEAVEVLAGGGPPDVVELTLDLAREMLELAGLDDVDPAAALADGRAMDVWRAHGAGPGRRSRRRCSPAPTEVEVVAAPATGTLARLDAMAVGVAAWRLGAGRSRKEDDVSPTAGVVWRATVGDHVEAGQPLLELHLDDADAARRRQGGARRRHRDHRRPRHPTPARPRPSRLTTSVRNVACDVSTDVGSEVLDLDRGDALGLGEVEAEDLGVEAELAVEGGADVLALAEAVLLALEGQVGDRHALARAARRRSSRPGWAARPGRRGPGTRRAGRSMRSVWKIGERSS